MWAGPRDDADVGTPHAWSSAISWLVAEVVPQWAGIVLSMAAPILRRRDTHCLDSLKSPNLGDNGHYKSRGPGQAGMAPQHTLLYAVSISLQIASSHLLGHPRVWISS